VRAVALFLCGAGLALAQGGTEPKPKAEDYEAHAQWKDLAIGAEYMVHSFAGEGVTYIAKDYLVVEVALYPPKGESFKVDPHAFSLRVNGAKRPILPVPSSFVASMLSHQDWSTGPRLEGSAGSGPADVIFGRPRPTQVPGGQGTGTPLPPRAPAPDPPGGIERKPRVTAEELVVKVALPDGTRAGPVSGFLYFPYKGKVSSIKAVDLLYDEAVVKLR
jgi:hypothetical protein